MQTPKTRNSSEVPRKVSPRASSLEVPPKVSPRAASSEGPKKVSPRVVRQLKTTTQDSITAPSPIKGFKTPTEKSPKVVERRSPRTPTSEKKPPSRVADLESQISQLQSDLKNVKDQLISSEACREQAKQDAEELKKQLAALSLDLEESQKQLPKRSDSESVEIEQKLLSELENTVESAALASAINEIKELKVQLEMVAESEATQTKHVELAQSELHSLKEKLAETLILMEDVKQQLRESKESEAHAQALVAETLLQLETAKRTVEALRSDGSRTMEAYSEIASELEKSRARVNVLEELVSKPKADVSYVKDSHTSHNQDNELATAEDGELGDSSEQMSKRNEMELHALKSEAKQLRFALEAAEIRYTEEIHHSTTEISNAHELVEQMKSTLIEREAELEMNAQKLNIEIEELKANLMDKETELQGICEENEFLNTKLKNVLSGQGDGDLEKELEKSKADIECLKASLMDNEAKLQSLSEENETLKLEMKRKEHNGKVEVEVFSEVETARAAEREALMKVGYMTEEVDKSNRKAARVCEQLEAAQAANAELEAELRRLKVQADQWRKAAEAAATMLSSGNNGKLVERTGSMDSLYSPKSGKMNLSYAEDGEDDVLKKKNANVLKKIGVLWKKPQK